MNCKTHNTTDNQCPADCTEPKLLTEIICVLDRSGSMRMVLNEAIGGFNTFLEEQKVAPGDAVLTLVLFDDKYEFLHRGVPIDDVAPLTKKTYVPRGFTALLDALGKAVGETTERQAALPAGKRPDNTIVVVLTDGHENASKEYTRTGIKELVEAQRNAGWEFIFLASGVDQFAATTVGTSMGIVNNAAFASGAEGMMRGSHTYSSSVTSYRTTGSVGDVVTTDDNVTLDSTATPPDDGA